MVTTVCSIYLGEKWLTIRHKIHDECFKHWGELNDFV